MTTDLNPFRDVDLRPLRSTLAGWSGIESTLLDTAKLANLAWKLGFGHFNEADIRALWRIGLVRADITIAHRPVRSSMSHVAAAAGREHCFGRAPNSSH